MKVILNCKFGENLTGETVELKDEVAKGLIERGNATAVKKDAKKDK